MLLMTYAIGIRLGLVYLQEVLDHNRSVRYHSFLRNIVKIYEKNFVKMYEKNIVKIYEKNIVKIYEKIFS